MFRAKSKKFELVYSGNTDRTTLTANRQNFHDIRYYFANFMAAKISLSWIVLVLIHLA